jgi:hypothetical protein
MYKPPTTSELSLFPQPSSLFNSPVAVSKEIRGKENRHRSRKRCTDTPCGDDSSKRKRCREESTKTRQSKGKGILCDTDMNNNIQNVAPVKQPDPSWCPGIISAVAQHPPVVAAAVNELARQMACSHHAYQQLSQKFQEQLSAYKNSNSREIRVTKNSANHP